MTALAPGRRHFDDSLDDSGITGAAAQVPGQHLAHLRLTRRGDAPQKIRRRKKDSRRAEAALERMMAAKRRLEIAELALFDRVADRDEPFDRADVAAVGAHRKREAAALSSPVDEDGAGPAHP